MQRAIAGRGWSKRSDATRARPARAARRRVRHCGLRSRDGRRASTGADPAHRSSSRTCPPSHLHVATGGPGSGKSRLIDALAVIGGVVISAEVGRRIIREQLATGGTALPWDDEVAARTEADMRRTYAGYGCQLVDLLRASVADRVAFVRDHLEKSA